MRATNMKNTTISKTQIAPGADGGSGLSLSAGGLRCGSWNHWADVQPDRAAGLHHPARRTGSLLVGLRLQRQRRRATLRPRSAARFCSTHADSGPDLIVTRADGHGHPDQRPARRRPATRRSCSPASM